MKRTVANQAATKIQQVILGSIHDHLANPDFDLDEGEVHLIDRDQSCLYFGLFEVNSKTGNIYTEPCVIWTVEVSSELQGR